jgi:hypothetical protein
VRQLTPIRIFHPFSWQPLLSFNHTHWLSEALKVCGAESITDTLGLATPIISPRYIFQKNTEFIVLAEKGSERDISAQWKKSVPLLGSLPVITVDPDRWHRPSPRFIEGLEHVCQKLHSRSMERNNP